MQVTVEATGELERRLTITLPGSDFESKVQERLRSMVPRIKMDGFRPGKVPYKVVERRYGSAVRQEVSDEFVRDSFRDAIKQESLRPAGMPQIEPPQLEAGESFAYTVTFEVLPEIESVKLEGIKIKQPRAEVTDKDIEGVLKKLQEQHIEWEPMERPAQEADGVTITYHGSIEGKPFPGGSKENFFVILGKGTTLKEFEEHLIGVNKGQELTFEITFPEHYGNQELAGKKASFAVKVISVTAPRLPEINEDFAEKLGVKEGGVAALRQEIKASMTRNLEQAVRDRVREQIMDGLLVANPTTLPISLVKEETSILLEQAKNNLAKQGVNPQEISLDESPFVEQARRRVALRLIFSTILEKQEIKADQDKIKQRVTELAASYEDPEEFSRWIFSDRERLSEIENAVMETQIIDWVLDQVEVLDKSMSFEEVVNPQISSAKEKVQD
ncbi:Trigger factor [Nitrosococcus oceani ATCC 19707]|uniref:Trigger factor n=2 Tax=Nitrosococcus oceani TaxID=1229 RepID=TIG_NITOC|nr:trigger factor [Nitrosococcus oceani]Q3JAJ7.1 RecName: Full=Trigger factor; Short=TF; AltName: Full=PPIase [Nitrosococcus oceani ATCC 19707]KFI19480.1 trigger factor [Nitrosococcus oceani C-27]ABA58149.1 Trigger factor [Nitrosococcus oceani ATCC 19707]EDZ67282.1 trigger factor [Nitrosococcus oceani AFC27]GEM21324.1 trigger factor [Nitrosococcus oceani]